MDAVKCAVYDYVVRAVLSDKYGVNCRDYWTKAKEGERLLLCNDECSGYLEDLPCPRDCEEDIIPCPTIIMSEVPDNFVCPLIQIT